MDSGSPTPRRQIVPGGRLFVLGPYLILAIAAWFLYANWNSIPESFPIHWARNGLPDRWVTRSVMGVFGLLLVGVLSNTLTILIALGVFLGRGDIAFKRATFFVILFVDYVISTLSAVIATRPVWAVDPIRSPSQLTPFIGASVLALVVGVIVYLARVARSRMGAGDGPGECWKWGMFYYNRNDSSLLVEKRIGLGWTLNFANKWAWAFMAMMLLPSILIIFGTLFAIRSTK